MTRSDVQTIIQLISKWFPTLRCSTSNSLPTKHLHNERKRRTDSKDTSGSAWRCTDRSTKQMFKGVWVFSCTVRVIARRETLTQDLTSNESFLKIRATGHAGALKTHTRGVFQCWAKTDFWTFWLFNHIIKPTVSYVMRTFLSPLNDQHVQVSLIRHLLVTWFL